MEASVLSGPQLDIMKVVWRLGEATVRDVYEDLRTQRTIAYTTVITTMKTMEARGHLKKRTEGRAFVYSAVATESVIPAPLFLKEHHPVQRDALLIMEAPMNRVRLTVSLAGIAVLLMGTVCLSAAWFPLTGAPVIVQEETSDSERPAPQGKSVPPTVNTGNIADGIKGEIPWIK